MCGIGGIYHWRSGARASATDLARMAGRLRHRGPDGEGMYRDGPLGLVHRRLAIIDIEGGAQPMCTPDRTLWISYNGEVYNYVELIDELRALGHRPRTRSDTEAVLLAYAQWGLDFVTHLNGMFALALWDSRRRRLILCRDRMGIKPLYHAEVPGGVAFASEIKALRVLPGVDDGLDIHALDQYMTCGYVVHPRTLMRGIRKVDPGTMLILEPDMEPRVIRYWQLQFRPDRRPRADEWGEQVRALFTDAVRLRLRSDVPLGTLLSGGVDSTAIAATMVRLRRDAYDINSFCTGVDMPGARNEFHWAAMVARKLGLRHHELRLSSAQFGAALIDATRILDEPILEPMVALLLSVCRLARQHVTVLLSGEGSDETWFGYTSYRLMYAIELAQKLMPERARPHLSTWLGRVADALPMSARLAKLMRLAAEPLERRYLGLNYFDTTVKDAIYTPGLRGALAERDAREYMRALYDDAGGPEALSRMAAVDCRAWLVDNTLFRSDHMSMAASLELRVPFLDHRLIELSARIPARFKVRWNDQKVLLKQALSDRLPANVRKRRKMGFPTPIAVLFRSDWSREVEHFITTPSATTEGLFDRDRLTRMLAEHRSGDHDWSRVLFQILMLELWAHEAEAIRAERGGAPAVAV